MLNKRGEGTKYLSIWWFLMLIFIGVSVFIGAWMYFGVGVNVKGIDSLVLEESLADCLLNDDGFLNVNLSAFIFEDKAFDVFRECDLNKDVFSLGTPFYFEVNFSDESSKPLEKTIRGGDASYRGDCSISGVLEARHFPVCSYYEYNFLYVDGGNIHIGKMGILAASDQDRGVVIDSDTSEVKMNG